MAGTGAHSYSTGNATKDWKEATNGGFEIKIPLSKHRLGKFPNIFFYEKENGKYKECGVGTEIDEKGNVLIESSIKFEGRIVIVG